MKSGKGKSRKKVRYLSLSMQKKPHAKVAKAAKTQAANVVGSLPFTHCPASAFPFGSRLNFASLATFA